MERYNTAADGSIQPEGNSMFTRQDIEEHLAQISVLDRRGLLNTLLPHRTLPEHDPARYIIDFHAASLEGEKPTVRSSYDLGVVFGRSLLMRTNGSNPQFLQPVVTEFDEDNKRLIDRYLRASKHRTIGELTNFDNDFNSHLKRAVNMFCRKCEVIVPDLMLDGEEEVLRGMHDYLSVINLLEARGGQQRSLLDRRLGARRGIGTFLLNGFRFRHRHGRIA